MKLDQSIKMMAQYREKLDVKIPPRNVYGEYSKIGESR